MRQIFEMRPTITVKDAKPLPFWIIFRLRGEVEKKGSEEKTYLFYRGIRVCSKSVRDDSDHLKRRCLTWQETDVRRRFS